MRKSRIVAHLPFLASFALALLTACEGTDSPATISCGTPDGTVDTVNGCIWQNCICLQTGNDSGGGGGSGGGSVHGNCSNMAGATDQCLEFVDGGWNTTLMTSNCNALSGTLTIGSGCNTTNRVGGCHFDDGGAAEQKRQFYSPTYNAATAESGCTMSGGTFIP